MVETTLWRRDFAWTMRRCAAWTVEMLAEAAGTSVVLCLFVLVDAHREQWLPPQNGQSMFAAVPVLSAAVLMFFGYTGYLITTAIAGFTLRKYKKWVYPATTALLYVLHSTIFFLMAGNHMINRRNNVIQLCGALVAFWCAWVGTALLARWDRLPPAPLAVGIS